MERSARSIPAARKMLSTSGTAPRTAQAAMRHSDIKLTMGTDTDPKLLHVRQAVERLPNFTPSGFGKCTRLCANGWPGGATPGTHRHDGNNDGSSERGA